MTLTGQDAARVGGGLFHAKCDPEQAQELRSVFEAVKAGYHMNKKHWNTVILDGSIPAGEIQRMIDHSYALVVKGLPSKVRQALELSYGSDALYAGQLSQR